MDGPCLSLGSWYALPLPASARFIVADLGGTVNGASQRARPLLGPFPPHKGCALRDPLSESCALRDAPRDSGTFQDAIGNSSAAGPKPGITKRQDQTTAK